MEQKQIIQSGENNAIKPLIEQNSLNINQDGMDFNFQKENIYYQDLQKNSIIGQLDSPENTQQINIELQDKQNIFEYQSFCQILDNIPRCYININMIDRYKIFIMLKSKNYYLKQYMTSGGEADIFKGSLQINGCVLFELVFRFSIFNSDLNEEINIMKSFEKNINIVKLYDEIGFDKLFILVLEQCQYSLQDELRIIQQNKQFPLEQLFQIIFDSIDGLIQLRIFQTIHLDIKPGNILKTQQGIYIYTDFGISSKFQKEKIYPKGYTKNYASQEQIINYEVNEKSDIYSLGITLFQVIKVFQYVQQQNQELCEQLLSFIQNNMSTIGIEQRQECLNIHQQIFELLNNLSEFELFKYKYLKKIENIQNLFVLDLNKDIPYFQKIQSYYTRLRINILSNIKTQEQFQKYNQLQIISSMLFLGQCYDKKDHLKNINDNKMLPSKINK